MIFLTVSYKLRLQLFLCLAMVLLTLGPAMAGSFSDVVLLGDSLSDSGNVFVATGQSIPPAPYYLGRFTNGENYADQLSAALGSPLVPSLVGGTNFAFGGARTDSHPSGAPFDLLSQLNNFKQSGYPISKDTLVIFFGGVNNLQDIIAAAAADPRNAFSIGLHGVENAIQDIRYILAELAASGAKHLLVPNAPDLGLSPRVMELKPIAPWISFYAKNLTVLFNLKLARALNGLKKVQVYRFNTFGWLQEVVDHPRRYGLINVTDRCYTGDDLTFTGGGTVCDSPDSYLFWDGIHPTRVAHEILAKQMLQTLQDKKGQRRHFNGLFPKPLKALLMR